MLGLFFNTFAADEKYSRQNRENFPQEIQMKLSQKRKNFSRFFMATLKCTYNSESLEKEGESHSLSISEI